MASGLEDYQPKNQTDLIQLLLNCTKQMLKRLHWMSVAPLHLTTIFWLQVTTILWHNTLKHKMFPLYYTLFPRSCLIRFRSISLKLWQAIPSFGKTQPWNTAYSTQSHTQTSLCSSNCRANSIDIRWHYWTGAGCSVKCHRNQWLKSYHYLR
jgi:hypothetical protein